jgi:hypothetical protein
MNKKLNTDLDRRLKRYEESSIDTANAYKVGYVTGVFEFESLVNAALDIARKHDNYTDLHQALKDLGYKE